MVTGIDLSRLDRGRREVHVSPAQLLTWTPSVRRINAEDPVTFAPSPGRVTDYLPPGGLGVRVDSDSTAGLTVPPHYDSLLASSS